MSVTTKPMGEAMRQPTRAVIGGGGLLLPMANLKMLVKNVNGVMTDVIGDILVSPGYLFKVPGKPVITFMRRDK